MTQAHTFLGQRGDREVSGVPLAKLYKIVRDRIEYLNPESYDPDAIAQNFCCEVEKAMGVYPNLPQPEPAQPDITAWAAGAFGASPELTAAWLAVMEAGIKSGEMPGWRSILSAPMDGTVIVLADNTSGLATGAWDTLEGDGWYDADGFDPIDFLPTKWVALPDDAPPLRPQAGPEPGR